MAGLDDPKRSFPTYDSMISRISNLRQAEPDQSLKTITGGSGCTHSATAYTSFPAVTKHPQCLLISSPLPSSQLSLSCTKIFFTYNLHPGQHHPVQTRHRTQGNLLFSQRRQPHGYGLRSLPLPAGCRNTLRNGSAERRRRTAPGSPPSALTEARLQCPPDVPGSGKGGRW